MPENDYYVKLIMRQGINEWNYDFFYENGSSAKEVCTTLVGQIGKEKESPLSIKLMDMHENTTVFHALVVGNLNGKRKDVRRRSVGALGAIAGNLGATPDNESRPALVNDSIQWKLFGVSPGDRIVTFSGLPRHYIHRTEQGADALPATVLARLQDITKHLKTLGLKIRATTEPTSATPTALIPVLRFKPEPESENEETRIQFSSQYDNLYVVGTRIQFRGRRSRDVRMLPYKGNHRILAKGTDDVEDGGQHWITIGAQYLGTPSGFIPHRLNMRTVDHEFLELEEEGQFVGYSTRQRGPAKGPTGRKSSVSYRTRG